MKKTVLSIIAIFSISLPALAHMPSFNEHREARIFAGLGLSIEQKQDVAQVMRQLRQDNSVYAGELENTKMQMQDLMSLPSWDQDAAELLISESIENNLAMAANRAFARHQVAKILDEYQVAEIEARWKAADRKERRVNYMRKMQQRLGFSEEQKQQAKDLMVEQKTQLEQYRPLMQQHRSAERELIRADVFDREAFFDLNEAFAETQVEIALIRSKTRYEMGQLLTDEQRQEAEELKERFKQKRGKHRANI